MKYGTVGILHGNRGPFTYRVPDDPSICPLVHSELQGGEYVIVKNKYGYSVGEVIEVHDEPMDYRDDIDYQWACQLVDEDHWNNVFMKFAEENL